jgi:hypothetical protein
MKTGTEIFLGNWTYRSFYNNPTLNVPFNDLRFGEGLFKVLSATQDSIKAEFDFGDGYRLHVAGNLFYGNPIQLCFRGYGIPNTPTDGWIYDYICYYVPKWLNGVEQRPALVGSVIRTAPHGTSPAGVVGSFTMVKQ